MSDRLVLTQEQPLLVDFHQQRASEQLFPQPPLLSSFHCGWNGIYIEHHCQPSFATPEHQVTMHSVSIILNTVTSERWFDGCRQSEYQTAGSIAIIPTGIAHRSAWYEEAQFIIMAIDPILLNQLGQEIAASEQIELIPYFATLQDPLIYGIALSLKNELELGNMGSNLYVEQLTTTFAIQLLSKYCVTKPKTCTEADGLPKYKLQKILEYIDHHLEEDINLCSLSKLVQMSKWYFCQMFKKSMGISPYQYVIQQRLERAKYLLKYQEAKISDIALACGFANQSHFTKHFCKLIKMTPKAYREQWNLTEFMG